MQWGETSREEKLKDSIKTNELKWLPDFLNCSVEFVYLSEYDCGFGLALQGAKVGDSEKIEDWTLVVDWGVFVCT